MMTSDATAAGAPRHRSLYGLIFVIIVYVGLMIMIAVGWPPFVEEMLLPRLLRQREEAAREADPAFVAPRTEEDVAAWREEAVDDLPIVIRWIYRVSSGLRTPGPWWAVLALPIVIGIVFEMAVGRNLLKLVAYYAASAAFGIGILVLAILVILEVLELVPAGSTG